MKYNPKTFFSDVKDAFKNNPKEISFEVDIFDNFCFEIDRSMLDDELRTKIVKA